MVPLELVWLRRRRRAGPERTRRYPGQAWAGQWVASDRLTNCGSQEESENKKDDEHQWAAGRKADERVSNMQEFSGYMTARADLRRL